MALSRPIGWLRDQRGDAVGLATADPLFQGGETKPTGYVATYSPVFTAEQVQQEIKEVSMALSDGAIIAMARDANPEHDLTAMLPFLSRFAALAAAREREKCATECESLSHRSRWVRAGINGAPMETCQYAAAIRARLEGKP